MKIDITLKDSKANFANFMMKIIKSLLIDANMGIFALSHIHKKKSGSNLFALKTKMIISTSTFTRRFGVLIQMSINFQKKKLYKFKFFLNKTIDMIAKNVIMLIMYKTLEEILKFI